VSDGSALSATRTCVRNHTALGGHNCRELVVQVLDKAEIITADHRLVFLQQWTPSTSALGKQVRANVALQRSDLRLRPAA
jgi:hypothetical protein